VIVVSDSSPLIALARVACLPLLFELYPVVSVPAEVYNEVVVDGAGLPGSLEVATVPGIHVVASRNPHGLQATIEQAGLGPGETAAVLLARELGAELVLIDEKKARNYAEQMGLTVLGCIGILEILHRNALVPDLARTYRRLLEQRFRVDPRVLKASLQKFGLTPI